MLPQIWEIAFRTLKLDAARDGATLEEGLRTEQDYRVIMTKRIYTFMEVLISALKMLRIFIALVVTDGPIRQMHMYLRVDVGAQHAMDIRGIPKDGPWAHMEDDEDDGDEGKQKIPNLRIFFRNNMERLRELENEMLVTTFSPESSRFELLQRIFPQLDSDTIGYEMHFEAQAACCDIEYRFRVYYSRVMFDLVFLTFGDDEVSPDRKESICTKSHECESLLCRSWCRDRRERGHRLQPCCFAFESHGGCFNRVGRDLSAGNKASRRPSSQKSWSLPFQASQGTCIS